MDHMDQVPHYITVIAIRHAVVATETHEDVRKFPSGKRLEASKHLAVYSSAWQSQQSRLYHPKSAVRLATATQQ